MKEKDILNKPIDEVTHSEYLDLYKKNIEVTEENNKLRSTISELNSDIFQLKSKNKKKLDGMFGIGATTLLICCFITFCVGSCVNGCSATEDHYIYPPYVVKQVSSSGNSTQYYLGNHVYLIGGKSQITAGDTLIFSTK